MNERENLRKQITVQPHGINLWPLLYFHSKFRMGLNVDRQFADNIHKTQNLKS